MAIDVHRTNNGLYVNILVTGYVSAENFKKLISRGLNTWVDAPAELKEFGDMLIEGKVLQDYQAQEHSKPRSE